MRFSMHADPKSIILISAGFIALHMRHNYIKSQDEIAVALISLGTPSCKKPTSYIKECFLASDHNE